MDDRTTPLFGKPKKLDGLTCGKVYYGDFVYSARYIKIMVYNDLDLWEAYKYYRFKPAEEKDGSSS